MLAFLVAAGSAEAGPWPRGKGQSFLSLTHVQAAGAGVSPRTDVYLDHGLGARLSVSLALSTGAEQAGEAALRWHLGGWGGAEEWRQPLSLSLAVRQEGAGRLVPGLGLHAGRGFAMGEGNGWARLDLRLGSAGGALAEIGLPIGPHGFALVGAELREAAGAAVAGLRVAAGLRIGDRRHVVLSARRGAGEAGELGMAFWHRF